MKILYGVQGTGNGHTTRARVMAKAFAESSVEVDWVFSGRAASDYFDMEAFGNYRTFRGLTFVVHKGRVDFVRTALGNNLATFWKDVQSLDVTGYDLVIADFEPVTAWAARRAGIDTLGLSHQCAFCHKVPKENNNFVTDTVMRLFAPVRNPIGLHWHHFNAPILPPIIDTDHLAKAREVEPDGSYLFYHPFMDLNHKISLIKPLNQPCHIYHGVSEPLDYGLIQVHPYSRDGFQQHLARCRGVITSAGFELSSEAIHLGKKLLVTPLKGQMEQYSNAAALAELGFGSVAEQLTPQVIAQWMAQPSPQAHPFPDVARALVTWMEEGAYAARTIQSLCRELWQLPAGADIPADAVTAEAVDMPRPNRGP